MGTPEIFNTDQGSQFTSEAFTNVLREHGVLISMNGKGRCLDNVFVERLCRSLKYDEVYNAFASLSTRAETSASSVVAFFLPSMLFPVLCEPRRQGSRHS